MPRAGDPGRVALHWFLGPAYLLIVCTLRCGDGGGFTGCGGGRMWMVPSSR